MTSPPENSDSTNVAPKPWKRWLPFAVVAALAGVIAIIAIASAGDDDTTSSDTTISGDTTNSVDGSVGESVAPSGSAATLDTSTEPATTAASATSVSGTGGPTSSTASTNPAESSPAATELPTSSVAAPPGGAPSSPINLGRAADFALLGNTRVESTAPTTVTGQIGASNGPTPSFSPTGNPSGVIIVSAQTAQRAQGDVDDAISELDGLTPTELPAAELTAQIGPGTYSSATLSVTGTVTLDAGGDPNALFVFESADTLTVDAASEIVLEGGALACNVYWRIGSTATLGKGSTFVGTLISDDSITAESDVAIVGRLIARNGAVTLDGDSVGIPDCV